MKRIYKITTNFSAHGTSARKVATTHNFATYHVAAKTLEQAIKNIESHLHAAEDGKEGIDSIVFLFEIDA